MSEEIQLDQKHQRIKEKVQESFNALDAHDHKRIMLVAMLELWQGICKHPYKTRVVHTGQVFTICKVCAKEW